MDSPLEGVSIFQEVGHCSFLRSVLFTPLPLKKSLHPYVSWNA